MVAQFAVMGNRNDRSRTAAPLIPAHRNMKYFFLPKQIGQTIIRLT